MIAIDTNILLRYLLQDDKSQSAKVNKLFSGDEKLLITDVVLAETIWTLKGKKYALSKEELSLVIERIFREPNVSFEDGKTVWRAYNVFRESKPVKVGTKKKDADFADALILEKSRYDAERKDQSFCGLYSFDAAAQQFHNVKKP